MTWPPSSLPDPRRVTAGATGLLLALFTIAKEIGFENIVFGSDVISSPADIATVLGEFTERAKWFSHIESEYSNEGVLSGSGTSRLQYILDKFMQRSWKVAERGGRPSLPSCGRTPWTND